MSEDGKTMDVMGLPVKHRGGRPKGSKNKRKGHGGGNLPKQWKDAAQAAGKKALQAAKSEEEKLLIERLMKLTEGDGATAFNAIRFLLQCRHDWKAPPQQHETTGTKPEKLGKKAKAMKDAQTAHENTEWGELLN